MRCEILSKQSCPKQHSTNHISLYEPVTRMAIASTNNYVKIEMWLKRYNYNIFRIMFFRPTHLNLFSNEK